MRVSRWATALAGALAAASILAAPAWADGACTDAGYTEGGASTGAHTHGISAHVRPLSRPNVQNGVVTAWVGIGPTNTPPDKLLGFLHVGVIALPVQSPRLFWEYRRPGTATTIRHLRKYIRIGTRHRVAVREVAGRPGRWRVWIDRRIVSPAMNVRRVGGWRPRVMIESLPDRTTSCNNFKYRFSRVSVVRRLGTHEPWRRLIRAYTFRSPGVGVTHPAHSALVTLKAPSQPPNAPKSFRGDWETGDFSQWRQIQYKTGGVLRDQVALESDVVRQGRYAVRFTVRPGDRYSTTGGERSEVWWMSRESSGQDYWYGWSTLFPTDWTAPAAYGLFLQWHSFNSVPPPIAFDARGDTAVVNVNTGDLTDGRIGTNRAQYPLLSTLSKGLWNDFIVHVHWAADSTGSLTVWHRVQGQQTYTVALDVQNIPTLQTLDGFVSPNYVKLGLYRGNDTVNVNTLYQDDFRMTPALAGLGASFVDSSGAAIQAEEPAP